MRTLFKGSEGTAQEKKPQPCSLVSPSIYTTFCCIVNTYYLIT